MLAVNGSDFRIEHPLDPGDDGKFPQIRIKDEDGTLVSTVNLTLVVGEDAVYEGTWSVPSTGAHFQGALTVYTDSGHTAADPSYPREELYFDTVNQFIQASGEVFRAFERLERAAFRAAQDRDSIEDDFPAVFRALEELYAEAVEARRLRTGQS